MRISRKFSRRAFLASTALAAARGQAKRSVFVVPNFHPASCGWLTNFSMERVYCANSYFDHLDRVRDDPNYRFALSECNNMIAMMNFRPERMAELKEKIARTKERMERGKAMLEQVPENRRAQFKARMDQTEKELKDEVEWHTDTIKNQKAAGQRLDRIIESLKEEIAKKNYSLDLGLKADSNLTNANDLGEPMDIAQQALRELQSITEQLNAMIKELS